MKTVNKGKNAIRTVLSCLALALFLWGSLSGYSLAQDDLIVVRLGLKNPDGKYLFNPAQPDDDPITLVVTVDNVSNGPLLASEGYADNLDLLLRFADPDGFQITAQNLLPTASGTTLPIFPDEENEENIEGEPVERVAESGVAPDPEEKAYPFSIEFDIRGLYSFPRPDQYTGKEYVPVGLYEEDSLIEGTNLARFWERIFGENLISNGVVITLIDDADGDGACVPAQHPTLCPQQTLPDCDDTRADVHPGQTEIPNNGLDDDCNPATLDEQLTDTGTIEVEAVSYALDGNPGGSKTPLTNLEVRGFDMSAGSCVMTNFGDGWQHYPDIWSGCTPESTVYTGNDGKGIFEIAPGDFLVIAEHAALSGNPVYTGVSVTDLKKDDVVQKYLTLVMTDGEVMPAVYHMLEGSQLFIIQPEYMEWPAGKAKRPCPFVFDASGKWKVEIELYPPKRFEVKPNSIDVRVDSELKTEQAEIKKNKKAKSNPLKVKYTVKHGKEKKKHKIESTIYMKVSD
jgi:hypothetical protein